MAALKASSNISSLNSSNDNLKANPQPSPPAGQTMTSNSSTNEPSLIKGLGKSPSNYASSNSASMDKRAQMRMSRQFASNVLLRTSQGLGLGMALERQSSRNNFRQSPRQVLGRISEREDVLDTSAFNESNRNSLLEKGNSDNDEKSANANLK